ncbi:unnamed protein product [Mytilus coruscus]|uniref:Uncharacterized protein n=1 Tax=Mytilus coruscus TaxID=42192 RepID=A0A6J8DYV1_MYTCO|nr:unnamed protein product [Mytilus coruscus]
MENCACCGEHFSKRKDRKGYERTNIHTNYKTFGSVANVIEGLYGVTVTPSKDVYVCNNCTCLITTANKKAEQLGETESRLRKSVTVNNTKIGQAVSNIGRGKYSKGFRELWKQSKTAKRAAIHVLQDEIRKEVTEFAKATSVADDGWEDILDEWEDMEDQSLPDQSIPERPPITESGSESTQLEQLISSDLEFKSKHL